MWCNFVPTTTVLVRRRCLAEMGGFPEACPLSGDYPTWFRIALRHELDYVDRPVAEYAVHAGGISYDLGRALDTRIQLFSRELEATTDPVTRFLLRRLLFNLALRLALAVARGRARTVARPLRLVLRTATAVAGVQAGAWTAAFGLNEIRVRARRLRP